MKNKVELPLVEPIYGTYHFQGSGGAVLYQNRSIENWYLNEIAILSCTERYKRGFTSPELNIVFSSWVDNPYLEKRWYKLEEFDGDVNAEIKSMLDSGYYVCFEGVDDYYIDGKSLYGKKHFKHDCLICGYDEEDGTYLLYAYDSKWVYRTFKTPQKSFDKGREAMTESGFFGFFCGIKPMSAPVKFSCEKACKSISEYLNPTYEKQKASEYGDIFGIEVMRCTAEYIELLYSKNVPYERIDRRIMRLIWEHKSVMERRIGLIEDVIGTNGDIATAYKKVTDEMNAKRLLYASHILRRRDSLLPQITEAVLSAAEEEQELLGKLLKYAENRGIAIK